jgi:hypothetical protein
MYSMEKDTLALLTKYHMPNAKCIDMLAVKLSFRDDPDKEVLLLHLPKLKVSLKPLDRSR